MRLRIADRTIDVMGVILFVISITLAILGEVDWWVVVLILLSRCKITITF